jgi:hypothetical protein
MYPHKYVRHIAGESQSGCASSQTDVPEASAFVNAAYG